MMMMMMMIEATSVCLLDKINNLIGSDCACKEENFLDNLEKARHGLRLNGKVEFDRHGYPGKTRMGHVHGRRIRQLREKSNMPFSQLV